MFKLTFHRGSLSGETLKISTPKIILGRSRESCDVWLDDDGVSREHSRIEEREDGIYVTDLDSRNGTWVNRQRITEQRLASGDDVRIGPVKLTFEVIDTAPLYEDETAVSEPREKPRRTLALASLFALMRSNYGAVCLGLSIGVGIAVLLLVLLPNTNPRETEKPDAFVPTPPNGFARNDGFVPPSLLPQRQAVPENNPVPPRQESVLAALANQARRVEADAPVPIQNAVSDAPQEVRIITGFDGSKPREIRKVGENHFSFALDKSEDNYFLLKIEGAAGKKIRVDIRVPAGAAWASVNPVYSYTKELDNFAAFLSEDGADQQPPQRGQNPAPAPQVRRLSPLLGQLGRQRAGGGGALLPDTSGQEWHFIRTAGMKAAGVFSFEHTFEKDTAYVAMRVPYTYGYNEKFLELLKESGKAEVITVGKSKEGRNLRLVKISNGEDAEKKQPCVLIYAREHGYEADASFVAQGALLSLLSDEPRAKEIRSKFTFLIIPMLDPDGAFHGEYENITDSFFHGDEVPEAIAYASWFKRWMDSGKRLDVALNLHNFISTAAWHVACPFMEPEKNRQRDCQSFHDRLVRELDGYSVQKNTWELGYRRFRLGGWLREYYFTLHLPYEVNSQASHRHLTVNDLREIGGGMVNAAANFLLDSDSAQTLNDMLEAQVKRRDRWLKFGDENAGRNALVAEESIIQRVWYSAPRGDKR